MVPMRAEKRKGALHEPPPHPFPLAIRWGEGGRRSGEGWFMVPMRAEKRKGAFHEPRGTSNIQHPTPNIEWQRESSLTSAFGVRCWMFDVLPRFRGFNARIFISGKFLHEPSSCSGVSAERRWLLFPRIAALCRDAATPGFMAPMRAQKRKEALA